MGQDSRHKQSAPFGMNLKESFLNEAISWIMTHFGGSALSPLKDRQGSGMLSISHGNRHI